MLIAYKDIPSSLVNNFVQRVQKEHPILYKAYPELTLSFLSSPTFCNELIEYNLLSAFCSLELTLEDKEPIQSISRKLYLYRCSLSHLEQIENNLVPLMNDQLGDDIFTLWELLLSNKETKKLLDNLFKNYSQQDVYVILERIALIVVQEAILSRLSIIGFNEETSPEETLATIIPSIQEAIQEFFE